MNVRSKLPHVGTTIFSVMSSRAVELNALDIGQGFPDFEIDPRLAELAAQACLEGHDQFAPMEGVMRLREEIARSLCFGASVDPGEEITITASATAAIFSIVQAVVGQGDEVIVFDPCYDCYEPAVQLAGGRCIHVPLHPPGFGYDWQRVRDALSPRTRLVIFNSPHNPGCTVARQSDLDALAGITRDKDIMVISDEVYAQMVLDGREHLSVLSHEELRSRSFAVYSFGKTLNATGWRIGYAVAPPDMTREMRKVHQFNTYSVAHSMQHAIATYLAQHPDAWRGLAGLFQAKRDRFRAALAASGFGLPPSQGTYFQLLDFSGLSREGDVRFAERLLTEAKVATIPISPFYEHPPHSSVVRLCMAKRDATLDEAAARLGAFAQSA